jgi:hypothetical protein
MHPPRCYVIDWDNPRAQVLELSGPERRLVFGKRVRARIERADTQRKKELTGHEGPIRGALLLEPGRLEQGSFLTVGEDHTILARAPSGEEAVRYKGHKKRVRYLWDLVDHLVSWSDDHTVRVWTAGEGKEKLRLQRKLGAPDELAFAPTRDYLWLRSVKGTVIVHIDTAKPLMLKGQTDPWDEIRRLKDGRWVTRTHDVTTLWTLTGKAKQRFPNARSIESSVFELSDDRLLVVDGESNIVMLSRRGCRVAVAAELTGVAPLFASYSQAAQQARRAIEERPSIEHFEHRQSPYAPAYIPKLVYGERSAAATAPYDQPLWQFFNRPDFAAIHMWQRGCIQDLEQIQEHVQSVRGDLEKKERYLSWGILGAATLVFASGLSLTIMAREPGAERILLCLLMASGLAAMLYLCRLVRQTSSARRALSPLAQLVVSQLAAIEEHRARILADLPPVRNQQLYTRQFLGVQIERAVHALRELALRELAQRELAQREGSLHRDALTVGSLGIGAWAFLCLDPARAQKLAPRTLTSFWWTVDTPALICAVQRVQYLFLGSSQVEVVSLTYDFIEQRVLDKTTHAFAYRDLTDVTMREITRDAAALGTAGELTGKELVLRTASGESVSLVTLNEASVKRLRSAESWACHTTRVRDVQEQLNAALAEPTSKAHDSVVWALYAELRALACNLGPDTERVDLRLEQIRRDMLACKRHSYAVG